MCSAHYYGIMAADWERLTPFGITRDDIDKANAYIDDLALALKEEQDSLANGHYTDPVERRCAVNRVSDMEEDLAEGRSLLQKFNDTPSEELREALLAFKADYDAKIANIE